MNILTWIILGLVAGFIASKSVNKRGEGVVLDMSVGIGGALVGGCLFTLLGAGGVTGLNIYSVLISIGGAILILVIFHKVHGTH